MRRPLFLASLILCTLPGACAKKSQDAVVIGKEFVAAEPPGEPLKDARALDHDLWLVKIEMANGRKVEAPVEKAEWDALNAGDKVKASYSEGNYTGTIWAVDVKKK